MNGVWLLLLSWLLLVAGVLIFFSRDLLALWREPVMRHPVMIIESDDWGAGPVAAQAAALQGLVDLLTRHRDQAGRHPVMTLALVLAVPDGAAIERDGNYHRQLLDDPLFEPVRQAIARGRAAGAFALQLHGLEHYWPGGLMTVTDPAVQAWLREPVPAVTEKLPAHLQSRWVDASVLPSRPLAEDVVAAAVAEEVRLFGRVFGEIPRVAVPPTFVWTAGVEREWAKAGVEFVVTPGLRSACRDATGLPNCDSGPLRTGQRGAGVTYIVRSDYFEPERGHRAERALAALDWAGRQGRACLLETHRSNFIGDPAVAADAAKEIDRLFATSLGQNPALRFLSTEELGCALNRNDPAWVEQRFAPRLQAWLVRMRTLRGFWRLSRLTGLAWVLRGVQPLLPRTARS
jgi:hypothetical protein